MGFLIASNLPVQSTASTKTALQFTNEKGGLSCMFEVVMNSVSSIPLVLSGRCNEKKTLKNKSRVHRLLVITSSDHLSFLAYEVNLIYYVERRLLERT